MNKKNLFHIIKYSVFSGCITGFFYIILASSYGYYSISNILYLFISYVLSALMIFTLLSIVLTFLLKLIPFSKAAFILTSLLFCIILIWPVIFYHGIPELIGEDKINRKIAETVFIEIPSFLFLVWTFFTSSYIYKNFKNA